MVVLETPANLIRPILDSRNYSVRSISPEIAALSVKLEDEINTDPADRLIVATSIVSGKFFCDVFVGETLFWNGNRAAFMQQLQDTMAALAQEGQFPVWE